MTKKLEPGTIQKWSDHKNAWIPVSFAKSDFAPLQTKEEKAKAFFRNCFENSDYKPSQNETNEFITGTKGFFKIGDMIEDALGGNNWGVGMVIKSELVTEPMLYTHYDNDGKKQTAKYPINQWKYLIDFPSPDEKTSPKGEMWCWEFHMREAVAAKAFTLYQKIVKK